MHPQHPLVAALQGWTEVFMRYSMRNFILYSKEKGYSMSQIGALFQIYRKGPCPISDIGEELGITSAAASQMLDRLVNQNLIERAEAHHDRRVKQIALTEQGRRVLHESLHARQSWLNDLADCFSPEEEEQIIYALNLLTCKAQSLQAGHHPETAHASPEA